MGIKIMFKKIKIWWDKVRKFTPARDTSTMSDIEVMDELSKLYDKTYVFELVMTPTENYRFSLLVDVLKVRGYDVIGGASGITFESRNKK